MRAIETASIIFWAETYDINELKQIQERKRAEIFKLRERKSDRANRIVMLKDVINAIHRIFRKLRERRLRERIGRICNDAISVQSVGIIGTLLLP